MPPKSTLTIEWIVHKVWSWRTRPLFSSSSSVIFQALAAFSAKKYAMSYSTRMVCRWSRRRATFPQGLEVQAVARSPPIGGSPPWELANSGEHPLHRQQPCQEPSLSHPIPSPLLSFSCMCVLCSLRAPILNRPSLIYPLHSLHGIVSHVAPRSLGGRPSLTSSLERHTTQGCIFRVRSLFGLRRSARHSLLQTPLYSTYNTTSYNSGACLDILKNDTYSRLVNIHGYSRGPEIFKATEAIGALQREAIVI